MYPLCNDAPLYAIMLGNKQTLPTQGITCVLCMLLFC